MHLAVLRIELGCIGSMLVIHQKVGAVAGILHCPASICSHIRIAVKIICLLSSLGRVLACEAGEPASIPNGGKLIVCPSGCSPKGL